MLKTYMCGVRRIFLIFLISIIFFSSISSVYAKTITINDVNNEFNTSFIDELNKLGSNLSSSVNTKNKTLDVYSDSEKIVSFNYTGEYIEYENRDVEITEEVATNDIPASISIAGIVQSIINLSGNKNKTIKDEDSIDFTKTYDTYGIQIETEHFEFNKDGGTFSGDFVRYFKMSFDTDKISALMEKYGVDASTQDPNKEIIKNLTPTLEAKEITENSVTLYPHIAYTNSNSDYKVYCYIYRSTNKNGTYEKVSDMAVNCLDNIGFVDENLQSSTNYYYKAMVVDGSKYSEILEVTTKGDKSNMTNNNNKEDKAKNPQMGVNFPLIGLSVILVSGIGIYIYSKKRNQFPQV